MPITITTKVNYKGKHKDITSFDVQAIREFQKEKQERLNQGFKDIAKDAEKYIKKLSKRYKLLKDNWHIDYTSTGEHGGKFVGYNAAVRNHLSKSYVQKLSTSGTTYKFHASTMLNMLENGTKDTSDIRSYKFNTKIFMPSTWARNKFYVLEKDRTIERQYPEEHFSKTEPVANTSRFIHQSILDLFTDVKMDRRSRPSTRG